MASDQLKLPFSDPDTPWSPEQWSAFLTAETGNRVLVTIGRARREVIKSKGYWDDPSGRPIELRLSDIFQSSPHEVRSAIAKWLRAGRRDKQACQLLDEWIAAALAELPADQAKQKRRLALEPTGFHHDLVALESELVTAGPDPSGEFTHADFAPTGLPELTWGRRQKSKAKRSLHLGSYSESIHRIHMHPVLDQANVPSWFVRYVLFHELLHAFRAVQDGPPEVGKRRTPHDKRFREREAEYGDYQRCLAWQKARIGALIRSARTGKPLGKMRRLLGFHF